MPEQNDRTAATTSLAPLGSPRCEAANSDPALDPKLFEELVREIGDEAAAEVRAVFAGETDIRLKLLQQLSIDSNRTKIGREAHSLKSSAAAFGYRRLANLAQRLERDAPTLDDSRYRELLDCLDAAYAAAIAQERQR